ncbi:MAG: phospholipase D-like domain-containing protein [Candidatus Odinarchaeia archaeon]
MKNISFLKTIIKEFPLLKDLLKSLLNPEVLSPAEFYIKFREDVSKNLDKKIVIYSPFTFKPKVSEIINYLKHYKGSVIIYTKPEKEFKDKEKKKWQKINIEMLKEAGFEVRTKEGMHKKAVLIGDKIAYFGSLNVLSKWGEEERNDYIAKIRSSTRIPSYRRLCKRSKRRIA